MEITRKDLGSLTFEITLRLDNSDYKPQFDQDIKKYRDKAHLKGFRKGKTPVSALKKMYGKSLLAEILNKKISEEFDQYIKKENINILGDPIPTEKLDGSGLDIINFGPLEFGFKIGVAPEFEVMGMDNEEVYDSYDIKISADRVNEEFDNIRKKYGQEVVVDKIVEETDYITLNVKELDDEKKFLENGIESDFGILVNRMSEEYKTQFIGLSSGDECIVDIFRLEKEVERDFVLKYFLKIDENTPINENFVATIEGVKELQPSAVNDKFFDKAFGESDINSEERAKDRIREELESYYKTQGNSLTERYVLESLVEKNDIELPHDFLREWLAKTNEKIAENDTDNEYDLFVRNLKWSLIKQNLGKKYEVDVKPDEIKSSMVEKVKKLMQSYNYSGLDYEAIAQNMMQKPEKIKEEFEEVYARKVFDRIMQSLTLRINKIDIEDFKERVKKLEDQN